MATLKSNTLLQEKKDQTSFITHEPHSFAVQSEPHLGEEKMKQAQLDDKTKLFQQYYQGKVNKIFQPDLYEEYVGGKRPTGSPLLAALHDAHKSSYLTPLPASAYERQIDVDSKYIREGRYKYGAQ